MQQLDQHGNVDVLDGRRIPVEYRAVRLTGRLADLLGLGDRQPKLLPVPLQCAVNRGHLGAEQLGDPGGERTRTECTCAMPTSSPSIGVPGEPPLKLNLMRSVRCQQAGKVPTNPVRLTPAAAASGPARTLLRNWPTLFRGRA